MPSTAIQACITKGGTPDSRRSSTVPIPIEIASKKSRNTPSQCDATLASRLNTITPQKASAMPSQRRKGTVSSSQTIASNTEMGT